MGTLYTMAATATLDLCLRRIGAGAYDLAINLCPPGSNLPAELARQVSVAIDLGRQLEVSLDPMAYGRLLTGSLFAAEPARRAWEQARAFVSGAGAPLRVCLQIDSTADELHGLRWETLADPGSGAPVAQSEQMIFARTLGSTDLGLVPIPARPELRALLVAAGPGDLPAYGLAPLDAEGELARSAAALDGVAVTVLGHSAPGALRATLANLLAALREGPHILYLICHGTLAQGEPYLWLEDEGGRTSRVSGALLAERIGAMDRRPLLVVLASCQSAGGGSDTALAALGPRLARAGVAAVLAMQGVMSTSAAQSLVPALFRELRHDGQIDRALAAARSAIADGPDWWRPALFMRVRDGRLWREPDERPEAAQDSGHAREELSRFVAVALLAYERRLLAARPRRRQPPAEPYRGLLAYEFRDADYFYGREAAVAALAEMLSRLRLAVLHAPGGAGKTSLVSAGLAPRLFDSGHLPVVVRVGADPARALRAALAAPDLGVAPPAHWHTLGLAELVAALCRQLPPAGQRLVLIFDQLEELFIASPGREARAAFASELAACVAGHDLPVSVLLCVRADYFSELAAFTRELPAIFHNQHRLDPMGRDEATEAITQPLGDLRPPLGCEPTLLEALLADLERAGVELTHLQLICARLFASLGPGERLLTLEHYRQLGGAAAILGGYLRHEVAALGQAAPLARAILSALVAGDGTRQALALADLRDQLAQRDDMAELDGVLDALVAARLARREQREGVARYELAHDYLVAEVRAWITPEDLAAQLARGALGQAMAGWRERGWTMDARALALVHEQRALLAGLSVEEVALIFHSAVAQRRWVEIWAATAHRRGLAIWPVLRPLLRSYDYRVRAEALAAVAPLGATAIPALREALADPAPLVRTRAICGLAAIPGDQAAEALRGGLRHEVFVPPRGGTPGFYIERWPVTCAAYARFLAGRPEQQPPPSWTGRTPPQGCASHPVVEVSWHDAVAYAAWAGRRL
ncbi:MAG: CHAT domain-containing protein, partial [Chloroflexales bacterium]|nr:CHAT domain-containing protein [Chloroflexales bacterium]